MGSLKTLNLPEGDVKFAGFPRGGDEYLHSALEITLLGHPPAYGEWNPKFAENGNDFDIEIVSFGYSDRNNLGNGHPEARRLYSRQEAHKIEELVKALFANKEARVAVSPFSSRRAVYLGGLIFRSGWVREGVAPGDPNH